MDEGNYSCSVENVYGKDEIIYNLIIEGVEIISFLNYYYYYGGGVVIELRNNN